MHGVAELREKGRDVLVDLALGYIDDQIRADALDCHVYASLNRPVSHLWASNLNECKLLHLNDYIGSRKVHTWVVSEKELDEDVIYDYELTWAYSPLSFKER